MTALTMSMRLKPIGEYLLSAVPWATEVVFAVAILTCIGVGTGFMVGGALATIAAFFSDNPADTYWRVTSVVIGICVIILAAASPSIS